MLALARRGDRPVAVQGVLRRAWSSSASRSRSAPSPYDDPSIARWRRTRTSRSTSRVRVRAPQHRARGPDGRARTRGAARHRASTRSVELAAPTTRGVPYAYVRPPLVVGVVCLLNAHPGAHRALLQQGAAARRGDPGVLEAGGQATSTRDRTTRACWRCPARRSRRYRWGDMKDPIEPGLMDRPYVDRELVPAGSEPAANLVQALDQRLQEQAILDPDAIAPVARLMGVGDVELRMDLQTDQYGLIPAGRAVADLHRPGAHRARRAADVRHRDPGQARVPGARRPLPLGPKRRPSDAGRGVPGRGSARRSCGRSRTRAARRRRRRRRASSTPRPPACSTRAARPLLGAVRAATRRSSASLAPDATLVVTDSNRRRGTRWSGHDEQLRLHRAGGREAARRRPARPAPRGVPRDHRRVAHGHDPLRGEVDPGDDLRVARAINYAPETRPAPRDGRRPRHGVAGRPRRGPVGPERLRVELEQPITTNHLNLAQLSRVLGRRGPTDPRYITRVELTFDDGNTVHRGASARRSRRRSGQDVRFPRRTFSTVELQIEKVHGNVRTRAGDR